MNISRALIIITFLFILVSCGVDTNTKTTSDSDIEYTNLKTTQSLKQDHSNQAKETLTSHNDITSVSAVNTTKDIIIAFEIYHLKRFSLKKVRKEIQKKMEKKFSDLNVIVSTDKKIFLELNELEKKINADSISEKELDKKIKALIKLAKEQT
jgi:apolipoprotein N-acyltransferase